MASSELLAAKTHSSWRIGAPAWWRDPGGAPAASTAVHFLNHSEPHVLFMLFIPFRHSFSKILAGYNFWEILQRRVARANYSPWCCLKGLTDTHHLLTHSRFPAPSAGTSVGPGGLPRGVSPWFPCPYQDVVCHLQLNLGMRAPKDHLSGLPELQTYSSLLPLCSSSLTSSWCLGSVTAASIVPLFCASDLSALGGQSE